jgi:hypothetical protein
MRVVLEVAPCPVVHARGQPLGRRPNFQNALHAVMFEQLRTQDLRRFARGHAPRHVQLPQAILRRHVALREHEVVEIGGFDVGDSMLVAPHQNRSRQPRRQLPTVQLRQRRLHLVLQPDAGGQHQARNRQDDQKRDNDEDPQRRMPAFVFNFYAAS